MKRIFRNRALLTIGISQSVSGVGNWITMLSIFSLIVFYSGGGVEQTSWILLAGLVPSVVCSPIAGWLCDHFDRKWLMIVSELCAGLMVLAIILSRRVEFVYAFLSLQSAASALLPPAAQSALPSVVKQEDLSRANAMLQQLAGIIKMGAPLLAGFLLTFLLPQQAMILDVVSYVLSVLILCALPSLPPAGGTHKNVEPVISAQVGEGNQRKQTVLRALRSSNLLVLLFVNAFFLILLIGNFDLLGPVFVRDTMQLGASFYGVLIGCVGAGMLLGSLFLMVRKGRPQYWRDIVVGMIMLASLPAIIYVISLGQPRFIGVTVLIVGCLLCGTGSSFLLVQEGTLLQLLSPLEVLGRMSGLFQSVMGIAQLLLLLLSPLVSPVLIPIGTYLGIGALLMLLLALCTIITLYRTRKNIVSNNGAEIGSVASVPVMDQ
jgi:MFS family permease